LKSVSGKEFARLLKKRGWQVKRVNGSHHIYVKNGCNIRISLPIHGAKALKLGLLKHLMKLANITESDLI